MAINLEWHFLLLLLPDSVPLCEGNSRVFYRWILRKVASDIINVVVCIVTHLVSIITHRRYTGSVHPPVLLRTPENGCRSLRYLSI